MVEGCQITFCRGIEVLEGKRRDLEVIWIQKRFDLRCAVLEDTKMNVNAASEITSLVEIDQKG